MQPPPFQRLCEAELRRHPHRAARKRAFWPREGRVHRRHRPAIGRFELAHHGTLFLDEVGEIPLESRGNCCARLQEREFEPLGITHTLKSMSLGRCHQPRSRSEGRRPEVPLDLFYRLNVFPVRVPPLRERPEDIPLLVRHFTQQFARRMNKKIETIPSEMMSVLCDYHWPGNIRELQNLIERAVILTPGKSLEAPLGELRKSKWGRTGLRFIFEIGRRYYANRQGDGCFHEWQKPEK